jgi:integrase
VSELETLRAEVVSELRLTEAQWAAHYRADYSVRDKSYRRFELGQDVGRFIRTMRTERKAELTRDDYEYTLRLLVLDHRDLSVKDFEGGAGIDLLYDFLDRHWSEAAPGTVNKRIAAIRQFFQWAEDTDRVVKSPARRLRPLKSSRRSKRRAHPLVSVQRIAASQRTISHQAFILVMGRLGLRKMEAAHLRIRDVDLIRDVIYIPDSKTGEPAEVPITYQDVRAALNLWVQEGHHPDTRLIAPKGRPTSKCNPATAHRRFKQCLAAAGFEDFEMHELRHSAADHIHRETRDLVAAQELLRHQSVATTRGYLHPTHDDLRERMREADK